MTLSTSRASNKWFALLRLLEAELGSLVATTQHRQPVNIGGGSSASFGGRRDLASMPLSARGCTLVGHSGP